MAKHILQIYGFRNKKDGRALWEKFRAFAKSNGYDPGEAAARALEMFMLIDGNAAKIKPTKEGDER